MAKIGTSTYLLISKKYKQLMGCNENDIYIDVDYNDGAIILRRDKDTSVIRND
jgi:hypothetical protein